MANFIFLDVDGVLNSIDFNERCEKIGFTNWWNLGLLDQDCVLRLKHLAVLTGAKIVICSSWRTSNNHMAMLSQQLSFYGLSIYGTTNEKTDLGRGAQIQQWIDNHENVDNYVIFDDDNSVSDYRIDTEVYKHLIVPFYKKGLCEQDIDDALKLFEGE